MPGPPSENVRWVEGPAPKRAGPDIETSPVAAFGEVSMPFHRTQTRKNPPLSGTGMALAIDYYNLGVAALSPNEPRRGGARNRADRISHALTVAQTANLIAAERHTAAIGLPFTRMITIHWEAAGVPLPSIAKATGRFIDLMTKALRRHGSRTAWLWVHEGGAGKGGHCHILAHVPAELTPVIARLQRGWLRAITGEPYRARVIRSRPIGGRLGLEKNNPALHAINLEIAMAYLLKGAAPEAATRFNLERLDPGGIVIGKRCGTSQNIGLKARRRKPEALAENKIHIAP